MIWISLCISLCIFFDDEEVGMKLKNLYVTGIAVVAPFLLGALIRHGETASLINADGTLNVEDNVEYVALCLYTANATTGLSWNITGGAGMISASNTLGTDKQITVAQASNFFNVRESDSLASIQDKCRVDFQRRVKPSVLMNLSRLIAYDYTYFERNNAAFN